VYGATDQRHLGRSTYHMLLSLADTVAAALAKSPISAEPAAPSERPGLGAHPTRMRTPLV